MLLRDLRLHRFLAILAIAFAGAVAAAPADDLRDAQKLYGQGKLQPAMEKVEAYLKSQPREPQGRFLKGLILTEQHKVQEAIQVFTGLTEDFPELPEPYNNLAVLYASLGNYDKAKSALELAIHTHPSYATAHENLGDIYAQLASRAYDRALQLDKNNTTAQVKLAMVKDLFSSQKIAAAAPEPAKSATELSKPSPAPVAKVEPGKTAAAKTGPEIPAPVKPAPTNVRAPASGETRAQVESAIEAWASAWSTKDVKGYLAAYAPDFETPGGEARSAWEKTRTERIERPKSIAVTVKIQSMKIEGNVATALIRQGYRSDTFKGNSTKTLTMMKVGDKWLIKQERGGG